MKENKVRSWSLWTDFDIDLFKAGKHFRLYERFGAHLCEVDGVAGVYFSVWAPGASDVQVIGDFNYWGGDEHRLMVRWDNSGIWEGFIPGMSHGQFYKYKVFPHHNSDVQEKADPYGFFFEHPPRTSTVIWQHHEVWSDRSWMKQRKNPLSKPISIYEVHLASWMKNVDEERSLSYIELAERLVNYVRNLNFTHVEFMPVTEFPYDPSWGYQVTGYFAPTSRFGTPEEFGILVDSFHQAGIGVILDWVPAHFPSDEYALARFDGSHVYEHPDPRKGYHPDWKSLIFNYERPEVRSFLISSAFFWLDRFHIDGLRVDAVASMLYLDYSRKEGEWEPNEFGGNENLAAVQFIKDFNQAVKSSYPNVLTIAEESTSFSGVTRAVEEGGLGFDLKWMMGWMHDTLNYFTREPVYRQFHQNEITFSIVYAFTERFTLPLSHDEVVHGKRSLLGRMPGDEWQRFANLRLLYTYMYLHPGAKVLFMGGEIGQYDEWRFDGSLDWHLLEYEPHKGIYTLITNLNQLLKTESALYDLSYSTAGFEWIDISDAGSSVISFIRRDRSGETLFIACNFTPVVREQYRFGVPNSSNWLEVFNSDALKYWGSGMESRKLVEAEKTPFHGQKLSIELTLPSLTVIVLKKVD